MAYENFGSRFAYFVLAFKSELAFVPFCTEIAQKCAFPLQWMSDFQFEQDPLEGKYRFAFTEAQAAPEGANLPFDSMEKVTVAVFQNVARNYNERKLTAMTQPQLSLFLENCRAIGEKSLCYKQWKCGDWDYFLLIYANRNRCNNDQFVDLFRKEGVADLTPCVYGEKMPMQRGKSVRMMSPGAGEKFFRYLFYHLQIRIQSYNQRADELKKGRLPACCKKYSKSVNSLWITE